MWMRLRTVRTGHTKVICLTDTLLAYLSVAFGTLAGVCSERINAVLTRLAVMQIQFTLIYICKIMCTTIM